MLTWQPPKSLPPYDELHMFAIFCIVLGYLLGSISTAILTCRLLGLPDPRNQGSGNPGATNVLRIGGKKAAAITLAGDMLKGLIPLLIAKWLGVGPFGLCLVALAAFFGHLYPVFFNFQGGKGVATAFGALLGLSWPVALAALATWGAMVKFSKISSLAALTAAVATPLYLWLFKVPFLPGFTILLMVVFLVWRHKSNIQRLISGQESAGSQVVDKS